MQPPTIIRSLSSHNIQSKPPLNSYQYYLPAINLFNSTHLFSHTLLSFIIIPQVFCQNLPTLHLARQPEMERQNKNHPLALLDDRSCIQHQGGSASIILPPTVGRCPNGIYLDAMNSINDGDWSVAGNSVSLISGTGTGDNTFESEVVRNHGKGR